MEVAGLNRICCVDPAWAGNSHPGTGEQSLLPGSFARERNNEPCPNAPISRKSATDGAFTDFCAAWRRPAAARLSGDVAPGGEFASSLPDLIGRGCVWSRRRSTHRSGRRVAWLRLTTRSLDAVADCGAMPTSSACAPRGVRGLRRLWRCRWRQTGLRTSASALSSPSESVRRCGETGCAD